jgi:translation initiation factor IF-3
MERVNEAINYPEVRLLLEDGSQFGITTSQAALRMAQDKGLDLLEISPTAKPPVCKIIDYGRYKYERAKKDKEVRKKQREAQTVIKELRYRLKIEEHDYNVKLKCLKKFVSEGAKVKLVVRFRGREQLFINKGFELFERIVTEIADVAVMERKPELFEKRLIMIVAPKTGASK